MNTKIAFACLALCSLVVDAHADESMEFQLDTQLSYGYGSSSRSTMQMDIEATPSLRIPLSSSWRLELSGRLRIDAGDDLDPGRTPTETYSDFSGVAAIGDVGTLELRDAFLERRLNNGVLRLGKQQIVWGKLDGIKVLDVLNPQDFREFILDEFSESRIGLWSAYLDVSRSGWRSEIAVIVENTGHAIPARGAWFELKAPRYRYGSSDPATNLETVTQRDSAGIDSSALALRLSRQFGALELAAMAYTGLDHEPLGRLVVDNGQPVVQRFYKRRDVLGFSAETSFGPFALRTEVASQPDRVFNTRSVSGLGVVELDQLTAGVGVDFDGPADTLVNVQYVRDEVRNAPQTLVRPDDDGIVTVSLNKTFAYDTFRLSTRWYRSTELGDESVRVMLQLNQSDSTRWRLAFDAFSGDTSGVFGQFADKDRITLSLEHAFGQ